MTQFPEKRQEQRNGWCRHVQRTKTGPECPCPNSAKNGTLQASDAENDSLLFSIFEKIGKETVPLRVAAHTPLHMGPAFIPRVGLSVPRKGRGTLTHAPIQSAAHQPHTHTRDTTQPVNRHPLDSFPRPIAYVGFGSQAALHHYYMLICMLDWCATRRLFASR